MLAAKVAVLLISEDFLTSKFVLDEEIPYLLRAQEDDGMTIFPVLVWPCPWQRVEWLARLQMRPRGARPIAGGSEFEIRQDCSDIASEVAEIFCFTPDKEPTRRSLSTEPSRKVNDHLASMPQFDVPTAQQYAREGRLEEWIHAYLNRPEQRANPGLSIGLKLMRRWWNGPLEIKLTELNRCSGPELYVEYPIDPYWWTERTTELAKTLVQPLDVPPLIVHCGTGFYLSIRDGNSRHEAMRLIGWQTCWVIIWYDTEEDYRRHTRRLIEAGYLGDQGRA